MATTKVNSPKPEPMDDHERWTLVERFQVRPPLPEMSASKGVAVAFLGEISSESTPELASHTLRLLAKGAEFPARNNPWPRSTRERRLPRVWLPGDDRCEPQAPDDRERRFDSRPTVTVRVKGPASQQRDDSPAAIAKRKAKFKAHCRQQEQARRQVARSAKLFRNGHRNCVDCRANLDPHGLFATRPEAVERDGAFILVCRSCRDAGRALKPIA